MRKKVCLVGCALAALVALLAQAGQRRADAGGKLDEFPESLNWQVPDERLMLPFKDDVPIYFVARAQNPKEWDKLSKFWNETTEKAIDPHTGEPVTRRAIKIKVPLGLNSAPPVPPENPMTLARWELGKRLYFDPVLSSDGTVSCATCHDPKRGWTDQSPVSIGIGGKKGGVSAPTILNTAYNILQFWDGRAVSLEDQAQGPVANPIEMTMEKSEAHAWPRAVLRIRAKDDYTRRFKEAFGCEPTRDAAAKAIATFERTVLSGNSIYDRAEVAMRERVADEGGVDFTTQGVDYETVLKDAFKQKDVAALTALGLDPEKDAGQAAAFGKRLANGKALFFGKARCTACHTGDNFTDNSFHNLGVGVKDGKIPPDGMGRFARLALGHKNFEMMGAFKTPTLRGLVGTGPYMHDGSERTLADVVELYDRGGNANEFLSIKMRDEAAERAYRIARATKTEYKGPEVKLFGPDQRPIVPLKLNLTGQEKSDLVLFLRALQGDPIDPIVADPGRSSSGR